MKYLEKLVRQSGVTAGSLAYHDAHWTRRNAPLLDHMGAVIDHVQVHSRAGQPIYLTSSLPATNVIWPRAIFLLRNSESENHSTP